MPVSKQTTELTKMPAAVNIYNALENIDAARMRKKKIIVEAEQDLANADATE